MADIRTFKLPQPKVVAPKVELVEYKRVLLERSYQYQSLTVATALTWSSGEETGQLICKAFKLPGSLLNGWQLVEIKHTPVSGWMLVLMSSEYTRSVAQPIDDDAPDVDVYVMPIVDPSVTSIAFPGSLDVHVYSVDYEHSTAFVALFDNTSNVIVD